MEHVIWRQNVSIWVFLVLASLVTVWFAENQGLFGGWTVAVVLAVATVVRRRVYANATSGSARQYHNLAVTAEAEGRLQDALWWARRAHEIRPTRRSASYVSELARRVSRVAPDVPEFAALP